MSGVMSIICRSPWLSGSACASKVDVTRFDFWPGRCMSVSGLVVFVRFCVLHDVSDTGEILAGRSVEAFSSLIYFLYVC